MIRALRLLACAVLAAVVTACGFTGNLRRNPGFAPFGTPATVPGTDRKIALSLGPVPMRIATLLSRPILGHDEPWIPAILKDVRAVRVYKYEIDGEGTGALLHLDTTRSQLIADGWSPIAAVREDGGLVAALVMTTEPERIRGVVVMYQEDEELVLVNVIGKLRPETFGAAMRDLGFEVPIMSVGAI
jgi:hypothetical protein